MVITEQPKTNIQIRNRLINENRATAINMVKQRKLISQPLVPQNLGDAAPISGFKLAQRFTKPGRSTTLKPTESTDTSNLKSEKENELEDSNSHNDVKNLAHVQIVATTPIYDILSSPRMPSYQESPRSSPDNSAPNSDNLLQVDDASLQTPPKDISRMTATSKPSEELHPTTEHPEPDITTTLSLIEELKRQLITISYDLSEDQSTEEVKISTTTLAPGSDHFILDTMDTMYQLEDLQLSESRSVNQLFSSEETSTKKSSASEQLVWSEQPEVEVEDAVTDMIVTDDENATELPDDKSSSTQAVSDTDYETMQAVTAEITTEAQYAQPERSPKRINSKGALSQIIEESATFESLKASQTVSPDEVIKGLYHETNPGQYHETNPGQYHEMNPGQYHESNPGQYHETNPGQYDEKDPGQDLGVDNLTVNFDHTDESRIYNVKANAGDFIIGEVGRIDNSGQTLEV